MAPFSPPFSLPFSLRGEGLTERPTPGQLDVHADENKSLPGRWVHSQDLRVGDCLAARTGAVVLVEQVSVHPQTDRPVCNLTVRDRHTFLVGPDELLVHNESWCDILERKFNWERPPALKKLIEQGIRNKSGTYKTLSAIHGHHIVMKHGGGVYTQKARTLLEEYQIPLLETKDQLKGLAGLGEPYNLAMAINGYRGIHSAQYEKAVWEFLEGTVAKWKKRGESDDEIRLRVQNALLEIRRVLQSGEIFWTGYGTENYVNLLDTLR